MAYDYYNPYDYTWQNPYEDGAPSYMPPPPTPAPPLPPTETAPAPAPQTPAPPSPTSSDPWATAPADGNWQGWFLRNVQSLPPGPESLASLEAKLTPHGITVVRSGSGVAGKIRLPNGQIVDVGRAFSSGNPSQMAWQWDASGGAGRGYQPVDLSQVSIDPSYLAPFSEAQPSPRDVPSFVEPGDFQAPTGQSLLQDPSYLWRIEQGRGALENSAAARGVLNSGGTLQDILNYGQKAASQEYSNVWDRAFGVWNANWNNALTKFRTQMDTSDTAYNRAWNQYVDRKDTHYRNQNEPFGKLFQAASLGAMASR